MTGFYETFTGIATILALGIGAFVVNVLLHELGHAIPVLFWSKKKVVVFIGSHGDPEHSLRLPLGKLELYVKYNPFLWIRGLCRPGERLPVGKMIVITAMGPLVSLLLTIIPFVLLKTMAPDERQTVILVTFMVIGGMFTLTSAIPLNAPGPANTGGVRNDATQILRLWRTRDLPDVYWQALNKIGMEEYAAAAALLEQAIDEGNAVLALYRLAAAAQCNAGEYEKAQASLEVVSRRGGLSIDDQITDGYVKLMLGRYREAVAIYRELLRLNYNHFLILNNMGYALIAAGEPQDALKYLDRGLTLQPKFTALYATRAWAKIELGQWEEGLADAQRALKRNDTCADAYRVLGLYARAKGDLAGAKEHFLKARSLEPRMPFLEESLAEIERRLTILPEGEV